MKANNIIMGPGIRDQKPKKKEKRKEQRVKGRDWIGDQGPKKRGKSKEQRVKGRDQGKRNIYLD